MKECIDKMLVILPFEKDYFKNKWNWDVEYVGHPLVEVIEQFRVEEPGVKGRQSENSSNSPLTTHHSIAGKPETGDRKKTSGDAGRTSKFFPDYQFVVAEAPSVEDEFYKTFTQSYSNVSAVKNKTYDLLLLQAKAALVTSGTATLETALFGVPEVVCYKGSSISYQIGKRLVKVKYISLVNLIMDKLVVKELIQHNLTVENLKQELHELLTNGERINAIKKDYAELKQLLSKGGNASAKAANSIINFLSFTS